MSSAGPAVREFQPGDLPALLDLWQESWQVTLPAIDFAARRPWFETHLAALQAEGARLGVAVDSAGAPLGFVTIHPVTGYLDQLAVRLDCWGRGVAAALLNYARAVSPALVELKVNQANLRAVALYEKQGFARIRADVSEVSGLPLWVYRWTPGLTTAAV